MKLKHLIERIFKFEYWPIWVFYFPFLLQWLIYSIRSFNFLYLTRVNYKTTLGGLLQYSKYSLMKDVDTKYLPTTFYYKSLDQLKIDLDNDIFKKPFIYKPDIGERGKGVTLYKADDLGKWKEDYKFFEYPCLIQDFIDYTIELGILFYRFPSGKMGITSIVSKSFLTVVGNGKSTLSQLVKNEIRASTRIDFLKEKFMSKWDTVINEGESILLEEIGNHCRGTTFYNSNHLINDDLINVCNEITKNIEGFHYGRIDFKCKSIEELYKGEEIKIIEINGVNSEAAHIYDPDMSLFRAYKDVYHNLSIVFQISQELKKQGVKQPNTFAEFAVKGIKQLRG